MGTEAVEDEGPDGFKGGINAGVGPAGCVSRVVEVVGGVEDCSRCGGGIGDSKLALCDAICDDVGDLCYKIVDVSYDCPCGLVGKFYVGGEEFRVIMGALALGCKEEMEPVVQALGS